MFYYYNNICINEKMKKYLKSVNHFVNVIIRTIWMKLSAGIVVQSKL